MDDEYKRLDLSKLNIKKNNITTKEALKDVEPIPWVNEVYEGKQRVVIFRQE